MKPAAGVDPALFWGIVATAVVGAAGVVVAIVLYRRSASRQQVQALKQQIDAIARRMGVTPYLAELAAARTSVREPFQKGMASIGQQKWDAAIAYFESALPAANGAELVALFNLIGICHYTTGRHEEALAAYDESGRLARLFKDKRGEAVAVGNIGVISLANREWDRALSSFQQALSAFEELDARHEQARALGNIGFVLMQKGELDRALTYQEQALAIDRQIDRPAGIAKRLGNIGLIWQSKGDYDKTLQFFEEALAIDRQIGNRIGVAQDLCGIGLALEKMGRHGEAVNPLVQALRMFREMAVAEGPGDCLRGLASCLATLGAEGLTARCVESGMPPEETRRLVQVLEQRSTPAGTGSER